MIGKAHPDDRQLQTLAHQDTQYGQGDGKAGFVFQDGVEVAVVRMAVMFLIAVKPLLKKQVIRQMTERLGGRHFRAKPRGQSLR